MTTVNNLLAALKYLEEKGLGDEWVHGEHDIIYLPGTQDMVEMEEWGHWDSECDCWGIFT